MQLAFTGGVTGQVTQAINVLPVKTGADSNYAQPAWSTQCLYPSGEGAWSATTTFRLNSVVWQVSIGEPGFGLPKAGSHTALPENMTGGGSDDPNAVSINVSSNQSPDGNSSFGADQYEYYTPQDHNHGAGEITIDPGFTSGTVDIWLTPTAPDALEFRIVGRWSCR